MKRYRVEEFSPLTNIYVTLKTIYESYEEAICGFNKMQTKFKNRKYRIIKEVEIENGFKVIVL